MADNRAVVQAGPAANDRPSTALAKSGHVRDALRVVARNLRSSSRRRRSFDTSAFARRRDASLVSILYRVSFVLVFLIPSLSALVYWGFIASPQYVAEARFTVQGGEPVQLDAFSVVTGLPSMTAVQDTQVVTNYIESPSIVRRLQEQLDLRSLYGNTDIDWLSRFDATRPFDKLADYWKTRTDVSIQLPGGIVTMTTRAFSAEDALRIANGVLEAAEALVNELNRRMLEDNIAASRLEVERAAARLAKARVAFEAVRNNTGILDPVQTAISVGTLITTLRGDLLTLQQEYDSQVKTISRDAPQMRAMATRIKVMSEQIRELEAKMTNQLSAAGTEGTLSGSMTKFSELEVEQRIAEQQYISVASALELARVMAERNMVYLKTFLRPALPQEARYPRRALNIFIVFAGSFTIWATLCGFISLARNHMA